MVPGFSFWWSSRRESAPARIDNYPTSPFGGRKYRTSEYLCGYAAAAMWRRGSAHVWRLQWLGDFAGGLGRRRIGCGLVPSYLRPSLTQRVVPTVPQDHHSDFIGVFGAPPRGLEPLFSP
jgi:hypothetical protein